MTGKRPYSFELTIAANTGKPYAPYLAQMVQRAHALLKPPLTEMSLALVGDRRMSELHDRFMGLPTPTDVLTFPLDENHRGEATSGEVVVCIPEARRRAKLERVPVRDEILLYALHGLLHLCGFDDRTRLDFARMHRTEDDILTRLGVGPIFSSRHGSTSRSASRRAGEASPSRSIRQSVGGPARRASGVRK